MLIAVLISDDGTEQEITSSSNFTKSFVESHLNSEFDYFEFNEKTLFYNNLGQIGSEFNQKATQICNDLLDVGFPIFGKVLIIKTNEYEK